MAPTHASSSVAVLSEKYGQTLVLWKRYSLEHCQAKQYERNAAFIVGEETRFSRGSHLRVVG